MPRDLTAEPLFPTTDIQGDILVGLLKKVEKFVFFHITDGDLFAAFMKTLEITSMQECLDQRAAVAAGRAAGSTALLSTPGLNVALTPDGLGAVGVNGLDSTSTFSAGMAASAGGLGDPDPTTWSVLGPNQQVDGVFLVAGATEDEVNDTIALRLAPAGANGWSVVHIESGVVRPEPVKGHEHFGYADGVSQPAVRGRIGAAEPLEPQAGSDPDQADPGRDLLWPGEFVFGYPGQDPFGTDFTVEGAVEAPPIPFMANGAFLVFRKLAQSVPEFDLAVKAAAAAIPATDDPASAALLGAQMVGRWKSGAALIKAPRADDPSVADGTPDVNDFEFGGDRKGLVCPWAAHIRKAYPRDDVRHDTAPANQQEIDGAEAFTQSHRMLRRGIAYGTEVTESEALSGATCEPRGLLFACYVTDIGDQFEFVQEQWVNADDFSQVDTGVDAIIGQGGTNLPWRGAAPFSKRVDHKPDLTFGRFVHMQGGEYFFAPSIPALRTLPGKAAPPTPPSPMS